MPDRYLVKVTRSAEQDIESIHDFISSDDRIAAIRFIEALQSQLSTLDRFPLRCPLVPEADILQVPYRHLIHPPYRTIFRIVNKTVYVMRVIHGARLLDATLLED